MTNYEIDAALKEILEFLEKEYDHLSLVRISGSSADNCVAIFAGRNKKTRKKQEVERKISSELFQALQDSTGAQDIVETLFGLIERKIAEIFRR